jgi:hypothetical protein
VRLLDINGRPRFKRVSNRFIDWNGESKSKFQRNIKLCLKPLWSHHVVYEEFPIYGSRYTLDFFNATAKIAIEGQGKQHTQFTKYFQKSEFDYLKQLKIDEAKRRFCELNDIELIEVFYEDLNKLSTKFMKDLGA